LDYLVLGLVAGLAAVERKGFLQAMLSRPIVIAPVVGLVLGDLHGGLLLGPILELFWLGAASMGAAQPPHEVIGAAAIAGGAVLAGRLAGTGVTPAVAVLAVALVVPVGILGREADWLAERVNLQLAKRAAAEIEKGDFAHAVHLNLWGLTLPFVVGFILAPAGAAVAALTVPALLHVIPESHRQAIEKALSIGWFVFAAVACASGASALHSRRASTFFLASAALAALLAVVGGVHW
jgi:PTS system mannose-specific IIC component